MSKSVGDVEMLLEEWLSDLDITEEENEIVIRPRKYLGPETFQRVSTVIGQNGGKYIRKEQSKDGKPQFRIPKKQEQSPVTLEGLVYCAHCGKANKVKLEKA